MDLIISGNITKDTLFYINDNFLKKNKTWGDNECMVAFSIHK